MTIEYALTRAEIIRGFYESVKASSSYRRAIAINALVVGVVVTVVGAFSHPTGVDLAVRFLFGVVCYIPVILIILFLRAKTAIRTLTISEAGINTSIGSLDLKIPWKSVGVVEATDRFVLIGRTNTNAFFIPDRAFHSPDEKLRFFASVKSWATEA
jgi:hypothetical protein